jgi:hypothetical protein
MRTPRICGSVIRTRYLHPLMVVAPPNLGVQ